VRAPTEKLFLTICQVLSLHHGPIAKFKLPLPLLGNHSKIDQVIFLAARNYIQEFILDIPNGEPYKLPSSIFSCQHLERLELRFCLFNPPPKFKGFSGLLSLKL